jgi:DNA-binding MarR family transcriptional regulator
MTDLPFHRRTWMTLEPIHGMVYFSPLAGAAYEAIGLQGREGYFASRAAPLGTASAELVISTFFNFAPALVRSCIPHAWSQASPQAILAVRHQLVTDTLQQYCAEQAQSDDTKRAAEIAKAIATDACRRIEGRPLFAAHAALAWPDDSNSALVLWHAQTLLREFRGDGHIAALVSEGLSGVDAHVSHIATGQMPVDLMRGTRSWEESDYQGSVDSLVERGLVERTSVNGDSGITLTSLGNAQRQRIEDLTDTLSAAPYLAAGETTCTELRRLARPLSQAIIDAGLSPLRKLPPALADNS